MVKTGFSSDRINVKRFRIIYINRVSRQHCSKLNSMLVNEGATLWNKKSQFKYRLLGSELAETEKEKDSGAAVDSSMKVCIQ